MYTTSQELCQRFKVSERTITKLARLGIIPGIRIGRLWRFKISAIEEWERYQNCDSEEIGALVKEILEETEKGRR